MDIFKSVITNHKDCVLYFNQAARKKLSTIATLIGLRQTIIECGSRCRLESLEDRYEFDHKSQNDWSKVYCYADIKDEHVVLHYSYYDDEHVYGVAKTDYRLFFSTTDNKIIEEVEERDKAAKHSIEDLWLMYQANTSSKLVQAILADRLLNHYSRIKGLFDLVVNSSLNNIHSIFLHVIDYCDSHGLRLHKHKYKTGQTKKVNIKGDVVSVNQGTNTDSEYFDYGFTRFPTAKYVVNYWNDSSFDVISNKSTDTKHIDLNHTFDLTLHGYEDSFLRKIIPLSIIKWVLEDNKNPIITTTFEQFLNLKPILYYGTRGSINTILLHRDEYLVEYPKLTSKQWEELDSIGVSLYDILQLTTHRNEDKLAVVGFVFYGRPHRPNKSHKIFSIDKGVKLSTGFQSKLVKQINEHLPKEVVTQT